MKKVISLALALVMVLGIVSLTSAEEARTPVTITFANNTDDYYPKNFDEYTQQQKDVIEEIRTCVPGYEITFKIDFYEDMIKQMPILLAAGDVPDIATFSKMDWMMYLDTGMFVEDLNPYVDQYGEYIRSALQPDSLELCTVGGQLKAIPNENFYYKYPTFIRMDWVEKLGYPVKDTYTVSEIRDILMDMTTKDPDGNGKDDTYGLGTRFTNDIKNWDTTFMALFGAFGGQPNQYYVDEDANEVYGYNYSDDFRACLEYLAPLYQAGAIAQDCFILSPEQAMTEAINGKGGMYTGWWNTGVLLLRNGLLEVSPEADLQWIFVTSDDGQTQGMLDNGRIFKGTMISNQCEHPEIAIAVINQLIKMHIPGTTTSGDIMRDEDGNIIWIDPDGPHDMTNVKRANGYVTYDHLAGSTDKDAKYAVGDRTEPWANCFNTLATRTKEKRDWIDIQFPDIDLTDKSIKGKTDYMTWISEGEIQLNDGGHPVYTDLFYGMLTTDEFNEYSVTLNSVVMQWVVDFVTGEKELNDDTWQQYKENVVSQGAQQVIDSMTARYNEINGTNYGARSIAGK